MTGLDWIFLALLAVSLLLGFWRGLLYEVISLAGWVAAYFVARWGAGVVGDWLPMSEAGPNLHYWAGFALLFVATAFLGGMLAWLARRGVKALGMRPVDRTFGALFGLARGAALLLAAAALANLTPVHEEPWWSASTGVRWLEQGLLQLRAGLSAQELKDKAGKTEPEREQPPPAKTPHEPRTGETPALYPRKL
ncbi:MAG: CvpA family protein [Burkholderiaceae bacterium]|jgi:membrane protein required for colicin V production|nr:CvpA family protein [Burkholderiaceae bacterium]